MLNRKAKCKLVSVLLVCLLVMGFASIWVFNPKDSFVYADIVGYDEQFSTASSVDGWIRFQNVTVPVTASADSIITYTNNWEEGETIVGALFNSDGYYVAETETRTDGGSGRQLFDFDSVLIDAGDYMLAVWGDTAGAALNIYRESGVGGGYDQETYDGSFPDPVSYTSQEYKYSIALEYTPSNFTRLTVNNDGYYGSAPNGTILDASNNTVYLRGCAVADLSYRDTFESEPATVAAAINSTGANFVRLPVRGESWNNPITLSEVDEWIGNATEYELYTMIDMHSLPDTLTIQGIIGDIGNNRTFWYGNWSMMAARVGGNVSFTAAEVLNEPWYSATNETATMINWTICLNELAVHIHAQDPDVIIVFPACPAYKTGGTTDNPSFFLENMVNFTNRMITFHGYWKDMTTVHDEAAEFRYDWLNSFFNDSTRPTGGDGNFAWIADFLGTEAVCCSEFGWKSTDSEPLDIVASMWFGWLTHYNCSFTTWKWGANPANYGLFTDSEDIFNTWTEWGEVWYSYLGNPSERTKTFRLKVFDKSHGSPVYAYDKLVTEAVLTYDNGTEYNIDVDSDGWVNVTAPASTNCTFSLNWHGIALVANWSHNDEYRDRTWDIASDYYANESIDSGTKSVLCTSPLYSASWVSGDESLVINTYDGGSADSVLYSDDFSGDLSNWTQVSRTWSISSGELSVSEAAGVALIVSNYSDSWTDYEYNVTITDTRTYASKEVVFRYENSSSYYYLRFYHNDADTLGDVSLNLWNGSSVELATGECERALPADISVRVSTAFTGAYIRVWVDNELVLKYLDDSASCASGKVGCREETNRWSKYDDVSVYSLAEQTGTAYVYWDSMPNYITLQFSNSTSVNATSLYSDSVVTVPLLFGSQEILTFGQSTCYLTVGSAVGGSCNVSVGEHGYLNGSTVYVLATANTGYTFANWTLDDGDGGITNPIAVTMTANHTLTPLFTQNEAPTITTIELIEYIIFFIVVMFFSVFALISQNNKVELDLIAGICWLLFAILQFILLGVSIVSLMFAFLFGVFAIIFFIWMIKDLMSDRGFMPKRKMGHFD